MSTSAGRVVGNALFGAAVVLAIASGGLLAIHVPLSTYSGGPWGLLVTWLVLGVLAVTCVELLFLLANSRAGARGSGTSHKWRFRVTAALSAVLVAELALLTARFLRGEEAATAWTSGAMLLLLLAGAARRLTVLAPGRGRAAEGFALPWGRRVPGDAAPLLAQFAGLLPPLAGVTWAVRDEESWSAGEWDNGLLLAGSWLAGTAVLLLVAQAAVLAWASTAPPRWWLTVLTDEARERARERLEDRLALGAPRHWSRARRGPAPTGGSPGRYPAGRGPGGDPYGRAHPPGGREADDDRRRAPARPSLADRDPSFDLGAVRRTALGGLGRPLQSTAVLTIHRRTALETGLDLDRAWPRLAQVGDEQLRSEVRRAERSVLGWRIVLASAVCTTVTWLLTGLTGLGDVRLGQGAAPLIVVGPLLLAAFALTQARGQLAEVCARKAQAVDVLRYELVRALRLPPPEDVAELIALAPVLSGEQALSEVERERRTARSTGDERDPAASRGLDGITGESVYHVGGDLHISGSGDDERDPLAGRRLSGITGERIYHVGGDLHISGSGDDIQNDVRRAVREEVRRAIQEEYPAAARANPAPATLAEPDLAELARNIAAEAADPVSLRLREHLTHVQREFHQDVRDTIRTSLNASVTGPELTNFLGYLTIELDRRPGSGERSAVRAEGGVLRAPVGGRVNLVLSVVRDRRAGSLATVVESRPGRDFFVFEPVRVEGGREAGTVSFEAMADSSTLTALPQRARLSVRDEVQSAFGLRMPEEEGSHEVWIQLYQAGHLVQVVALKIEAEQATSGPAPGPGAAADGE
ncbi:hypothetical protein HUT18_22000 [Streptomyces sp. NA04227]|uniref:hypothetical protein n=1 Tax=Streptomyces sp. NA04227 TaxID=2742136 RepID=UPI0015921A04|nr:hypothetical protein [Streptomyces sp. NA04227]QKW08650.1 hypothetical protein HUT18_22000 [Streptomyces sp. NA04227]